MCLSVIWSVCVCVSALGLVLGARGWEANNFSLIQNSSSVDRRSGICVLEIFMHTYLLSCLIDNKKLKHTIILSRSQTIIWFCLIYICDILIITCRASAQSLTDFPVWRSQMTHEQFISGRMKGVTLIKASVIVMGKAHTPASASHWLQLMRFKYIFISDQISIRC